jgi:GNAT superfamily N-acetyltransferase
VGLRLLPVCDIPFVDERWDEQTGGVWPEYNRHGDVLNRYWGRLAEEFPDFQFVLLDEPGGLVARANAIPVDWDGSVDGLPAGIDGAIEHGFALAERGRPATALSALAAVVDPRYQGRGHSAILLGEMRRLAHEHGLGALIAPVRPSWKDRYPLTPIERYARWTRNDGLPFDPWIRTHVRLGGGILKPEPRSLRITGTVSDWEAWTEMAFPETGEYVFPEGLAPLAVDVASDVGLYWEPNVWMRHAVDDY